MGKANFNLAELLGDAVPNLDTASVRDQIDYIDIELLDDDPKNFYELSGVEELASNIELFGLQQPLRVRPNPEAEGRYIIVSGHRRRAATRLLVDEGKDKFRLIACIKERPEGSDALQELRLIYANSDTRRMTPAEISRQAERVEALLYQLKEEGYEFPGRMRDHVAEACQVSKSKLARLKVIREGLSSDFMEAFEKNSLTEQVAYALSRLPTDMQYRLFRVASIKDLRGYAVEQIQRMYENGTRWEPQMTCPNGKPCGHGDAALRHDLDCYHEACGGNTCCLNCSRATRDWSPCERMCSKAKAQRKANKEAEDKRMAAEEAKRINKYQKQTQRFAKRLLAAIDASGVSDKTEIQWGNYEASLRVSTIRDYANGKFVDDTRWYAARLDPEKLTRPIDVAKKLGCSADFLLGLTDEISSRSEVRSGALWYPMDIEPEIGQRIIVVANDGFAEDATYESGESLTSISDWDDLVCWTPAPKGPTAEAHAEPPAEGWLPLQWIPGQEKPAKDGQLATCKFMHDGMDKPMMSVAKWDEFHGRWCFPSNDMGIDSICVGWFPLPAE